MSADAGPQAGKQRKFWRGTWGGVLAAAVVSKLIRQLTDWPWWIVSATGIVMMAAILVYEWSKRRRVKAEARREAETAAGRPV